VIEQLFFDQLGGSCRVSAAAPDSTSYFFGGLLPEPILDRRSWPRISADAFALLGAAALLEAAPFGASRSDLPAGVSKPPFK
jgi:hypothetical protein